MKGQKVVRVRVGDLILDPDNARKHPAENLAAIRESIRAFGQQKPIVAYQFGKKGPMTVIAGNAAFQTMIELGFKEIDVAIFTGTAKQARAFAVADNRTAELAEWDLTQLASQFELMSQDDDLAELLASLNLESLIGVDSESDKDEADEPDDQIPAPPVQPVSRTGDIWNVGQHRIICGDSTDQKVVDALMDGHLADLCFTSPPYGNQRDYKTGGVSHWDGLMKGVFACLPMAPAGQVLVNLGLIHKDNEYLPYWESWIEWMRSSGWRRFAWYVWDQGDGLPGDWNGRLAPSFEFVFHFNKSTRRPNKTVPCKNAGKITDMDHAALRKKDGSIRQWTHVGKAIQDYRIPDSVIRVRRHQGGIGDGIGHPAVFSVALAKFAIENYTDPDEVVFEPFGGSGTTMLAAQSLGRKARLIELAAEYVDVALIRFGQNHPEVPITLASNGWTFERVKKDREKKGGKTTP